MYKYNILKPRDVTCKYRSFKRVNMPITILPFTTYVNALEYGPTLKCICCDILIGLHRRVIVEIVEIVSNVTRSWGQHGNCVNRRQILTVKISMIKF